MKLAFRRFKENASIGAMGEASRKWACAHVAAGRLVRVDVAAGDEDGATRDVEAAALLAGMVLAFRRFKESAAIGAMDEGFGKRQVLGF
jgi:hypothetical protein